MAWKDLTTVDARIIGLFSCIIMGFGIVLFVHLFLRYRKTKRPDTLLTAFAFLTLGSAWGGQAATFISIILTGQPLEPKTQFLLFAWAAPVTTTLWSYLGFRLVRPQLQYHALGALAIVVAIHLFGSYVLVLRATPEVTSDGIIRLAGLITSHTEGNMAYNSYRGFLFFTVTILTLSASLLVGLMFLRLSRTTDRPETRFRGLSIGIGALLLGFSVVMDQIVEAKGLSNVIIHSLILLSMILLYMGYILPTWLKRLTNLGVPARPDSTG